MRRQLKEFTEFLLLPGLFAFLTLLSNYDFIYEVEVG
jgi:hypothetical protein